MTPRQAKAAARAESKARIEAAWAEGRAIVATGRCPRCGSKLRRNLSLTGWWVCEQRGQASFRARPHDAGCDFDCMTGQ